MIKNLLKSATLGATGLALASCSDPKTPQDTADFVFHFGEGSSHLNAAELEDIALFGEYLNANPDHRMTISVYGGQCSKSKPSLDIETIDFTKTEDIEDIINQGFNYDETMAIRRFIALRDATVEAGARNRQISLREINPYMKAPCSIDNLLKDEYKRFATIDLSGLGYYDYTSE